MAPTAPAAEKKGHVCPKSTATHPSDRWETLFVYSFICKFTALRGKVEGLDSPMDLENALLEREPNQILTRVLGQFILNLRPQTRNLSTDQIATTVATVLSEYFKSSERTVFWNDDLKMNVDPFQGLEGGFFTADWDFKLQILRQLVELQLCYTPEIKNTIDRAWGVSHRKKDGVTGTVDASDPKGQENLQLVPIGQDSRRRRYWVADASPRVYVSTNPWKTSATFQTVATTREEYIATIDELKSTAPTENKREKRTKLETAHLNLISALEARIEAIDAEIARLQRVKRKIEQRHALLAQAEVRETRTRRQRLRPDYVYTQNSDSEDDGDEYIHKEDDEGQDDDFQEDDYLNFRTDAPNGTGRRRRGAATAAVQRRSTRTAALNANGKRQPPEDTWSHWRGERRSSRLGAPPDTQLDIEPPGKRARTEESTISSINSVDLPSGAPSANGDSSGLTIRIRGAAAIKPTEIALEQVAGRKKSKFWFYAVEPIPGTNPPVSVEPGAELSPSTAVPSETNGHNGHSADKDSPDQSATPENGMDIDKSLEGSLSPLEDA